MAFCCKGRKFKEAGRQESLIIIALWILRKLILLDRFSFIKPPPPQTNLSSIILSLAKSKNKKIPPLVLTKLFELNFLNKSRRTKIPHPYQMGIRFQKARGFCGRVTNETVQYNGNFSFSDSF